MSQRTDERATPQILFDELNNEFHFEIDLAANHENALLPLYYTKENSAFDYFWNTNSFLNPPYSELYNWLEYASKQRGLIVVILPCDTSTKWFHDFLWDKTKHTTRKGIQLRFPKGRFKFGKYTTSPKFATIIAIFNSK